MYISDNHAAIFLFNENTASRTITSVLESHDFTVRCSKHTYERATLLQQYGSDYLDARSAYKVYITVRNPFDRLVSIWARLSLPEWQQDTFGCGTKWTTFPEFLSYIQMWQGCQTTEQVQPGWISNPEIIRVCPDDNCLLNAPMGQAVVYKEWAGFDRIPIHQETLLTDLQALSFLSDVTELPAIGASGVSADDYRTPENVALVQALYPEDYSLLGY
jgi:hypothetical protein